MPEIVKLTFIYVQEVQRFQHDAYEETYQPVVSKLLYNYNPINLNPVPVLPDCNLHTQFEQGLQKESH